jgi:FMN phosphatase YigB (HAD superfamily)
MRCMANGFSGVLLDFAGTLFYQEPEIETLRAIGVPELAWAELTAAIARADRLAAAPALMPPELARCWERRDLTSAQHRAAFTGLFRQGGLLPDIAEALYARVCSPEAWLPFDDTAACLRSLRARRIPVAVVSNIGWDVRRVFERHGILALVDAFVLSYEHGAMKPDARLFSAACDAIGIPAEEVLMVGDTAESDGGATAIGCTFAHIAFPRARSALRSVLEPAIGKASRA